VTGVDAAKALSDASLDVVGVPSSIHHPSGEDGEGDTEALEELAEGSHHDDGSLK